MQTQVLLYNFFEDSTVDVSQWRVILNALESHQVYSVAAPTFNDTRHAGVCSEVRARSCHCIVVLILIWA
jgi:hypothetical protein